MPSGDGDKPRKASVRRGPGILDRECGAACLNEVAPIFHDPRAGRMAGPGGWLMHDYVSRLLIQERGAFVRREEGISSSGSADSAIEFANPVHVFSCLPRSSTS